MIIFRCAVCDDEKSASESIHGIINEYPVELGCEVFSDPLDLLSVVQKGRRFDLFILDIVMPGMTGVELAREIRNLDSDCVIIFLTSSDEFHKDAFGVEALQYLDKPANKEDLYHVLDRALRYIGDKCNNILPIQTKSSIYALRINDIVYVESFRHVLTFHLCDGRVINTLDSSLTLNELVQSMCFPPFCVPCRGFIINLNYVDCLSKLQFNLITGTVIPIPQKQFSRVRQQYSDYLLTRYTKGEN